MSNRHVSLLVCDELFIALNGKWEAKGIYTTDIAVVEEVVIHQMIFLFLVETPIEDPFESLTFEVLFPGETIPHRAEVPSMAFLRAHNEETAERSTIIARFPMLIQFQKLRAGKISAKVIHEKGEIDVSAPWIMMPKQNPLERFIF